MRLLPQRPNRLVCGLLLGLSLGLIVLPGCLQRTPAGQLSDLLISNRRFNIDDDRGLVRVVGRIENTGAGRFRAVEVHALLVSAGGDRRGENSILLEHLRPGEKRDFALTVTSHARVSDVLLDVREPSKP